MTIYIQKELFDVEKIISNLRKNKPSIGAVVSFIGYVREYNEDTKTKKLKPLNSEKWIQNYSLLYAWQLD